MNRGGARGWSLQIHTPPHWTLFLCLFVAIALGPPNATMAGPMTVLLHKSHTGTRQAYSLAAVIVSVGALAYAACADNTSDTLLGSSGGNDTPSDEGGGGGPGPGPGPGPTPV